MRITGHVRIEERKRGRAWVAKFMRADGAPTRKVLGPAWVKDSGRRTARGAVVWRVADGPKPDETYLTPKEAEDKLSGLMEAEKKKPSTKRAPGAGRTLGEACAAYLRYVEVEKGIAPTTLRRYRGIVSTHLLPAFGESTSLRRVTAERIEAYRRGELEKQKGKLSRTALRQNMVVLHGVLKLAQRRGWVAHNAAAEVERVQVPKASGDFNVLEPAEVEAVARAAAGGWEPVVAGERKGTRVSDERASAWTAQRESDATMYAAAIRFAAYTGLRLGELRALRWQDINFADAIVHVRQNAPTSAPAASTVKAPKSHLVRSVPLSDPAARAVEPLSRRPLFTAAGNLVFPSPTGDMLDGGKLRDAFYAALDASSLGRKRAKPNPITFHDLRHTFGSLAVREFPVTDVQAMMGHADISTTMRYVHHVPRHDAAARLSQAFSVDTAEAVADPSPATT